MTKKLLIIGFGNIGYRHFQGAINTRFPLHIDIVEPNQDNHTKAMQEPQTGPHKMAIRCLTSINEIDSFYDVVIFATCSDIRLATIKQAVAKSKFTYAIIEKVPFQSIQDYEVGMELLNQAKVKSWINCQRRLQPAWQPIMQKLQSADPGKVINGNRYGGDWAPGCNGIHDLDLVEYFCGSPMTEFYPIGEIEILPSKRSQFFELRGSFRAVYGNGSVCTLSSVSGNHPAYFGLAAKDTGVILYEDKRKFYDVNAAELHDLPIIFQSKLTNLYMEQIIEQQTMVLPTLEESYQLNKLYLECYSKIFQKKLGTKAGFCPIT